MPFHDRLEQADGISRFEFDAQITAKDMSETYLPAFAACVSEGESLSIMCSPSKTICSKKK